MPPVMGAAAFVISEMTGVSYLKICLAATIPAILYYVGVFVAVHMEAKRIGLKGLSAEEVLFFVFYFAIISAITPPVELAAYAAAGIADTEPMKTGFTACRIGLASFIVPYMFVLSPLLLMECNVYYMGNINCINWHINSGLRCNWTCCSCN